MNSVKLNKKHLFSILITLVLLFSFNLNVFAVNSNTVCFAKSDYVCTYITSNDTWVDCDSTTQVTTSTQTVEGSVYNTSVFNFPAISTNLRKNIISNADLDIYTNTKYKYDFYVKLGNTSGSTGAVSVTILYYVDGSLNSSTSLFLNENISTNLWTKVSGSFQTPNLNGNVTCSVMFAFASNENSGRYFYITDATFTLDDPLLNGQPIDTPSNDDLQDSLQNYDDLIGSLPTVDSSQIQDLMNFDFGSFVDGMNFVRDMFDRTLMTFNFNSILLFSLVFGLACLILGRKAGN